MNPSYWILWGDSVCPVNFRKFSCIDDLNQFLTGLPTEELQWYEIVSGFSLRQEVFR